MLTFKKLTLEDIDIVRPYFEYATNIVSDHTLGASMMWRDYIQSEYTIYQDTFILKVVVFGFDCAFAIPFGKNRLKAVQAIDEYCAQNKIQPVFCSVSKTEYEELSEIYLTDIITNPNWNDYLYNATDLVSLTGKKYNGQRNHINYFKKNYTNYYFKPISNQNIQDVLDFFYKVDADRDKESNLFAVEKKSNLEVLENFDKFKMLGGALYIEDSVVAFAFGEIARKTLFVHAEKADISIRGAYQMIVNEFSKYYASDNDILFINREEDTGDEGLRKSKLSYHPIEFVEKFVVKILDKR